MCYPVSAFLIKDFYKTLEESKIPINDLQKYYYFKDLLSDSWHAVKTYAELQYPDIPQNGYLFTYGIFQALHLQIVAADYFIEAFSINSKKTDNYRKHIKSFLDLYKELFSRCELPNHHTHISFVQSRMHKSVVQLHTVKKDKLPVLEDYNISNCINDVSKYVSSVLEEVIRTIRTFNISH
jgi:hypothetical protein